MVSFRTLVVPHRGQDFEISCFLRPGQGDTLVYLHGLGSTKYDFWGATTQPGLNHATLLALDFPGSGNSSYFDQLPLGMDDLVEITHRVVRSLELTDLTLIGHSMGGLTALLFALRYPAAVKRLISVEGNLAPEDCFLSRPASALSFPEFLEQNFMLQAQAKFIASPHLGSRLFADTFRRQVSPHAYHDYCRSIVEHSDSGRLLPAFLQLKLPRLFVYGSANRTLSYIPELGPAGISVVEAPGSAHWLVADNPNFFYTSLQEFLAADGQLAPTSRQLAEWAFNLHDAAQGIPRELAAGVNTRIFPGEHAMLSVVKLDPHAEGKLHSHPQEQWGVLLRGECVRIQDGVEVAMTAGDFWRTPGHVPHSLRAGAAGALVLDIFSPPRPEYKKAGRGFGPESEGQS